MLFTKIAYLTKFLKTIFIASSAIRTTVNFEYFLFENSFNAVYKQAVLFEWEECSNVTFEQEKFFFKK